MLLPEHPSRVYYRGSTRRIVDRRRSWLREVKVLELVLTYSLSTNSGTWYSSSLVDRPLHWST